jgi:hypothetical protein
VVARIANQTLARDARLKKLAESIDALAEKDERFLRRTREIAALPLIAYRNAEEGAEPSPLRPVRSGHRRLGKAQTSISMPS